MNAPASCDPDLAGPIHANGVVMVWVRKLGELLGIPSLRGPVDIGRDLHLECLVRPHAIELLDEGVEALLLLQEILAAWTSRFEFERPVHSLMTTIFLRTAGPD